MLQPFQKGTSLVDQAKPIGEILNQLSDLLSQASRVRTQIDTPQTEEETDSE